VHKGTAYGAGAKGGPACKEPRARDPLGSWGNPPGSCVLGDCAASPLEQALLDRMRGRHGSHKPPRSPLGLRLGGAPWQLIWQR
jgi:hypothetical protein